MQVKIAVVKNLIELTLDVMSGLPDTQKGSYLFDKVLEISDLPPAAAVEQRNLLVRLCVPTTASIASAPVPGWWCVGAHTYPRRRCHATLS